MRYSEMDSASLSAAYTELKGEYEAIKAKGMSLDISRGKPCTEQLNLSDGMLTVIADGKDAKTKASQGQQRTAMISFKLACAELAKNEMNEMPVLLLDDVLFRVVHYCRELLQFRNLLMYRHHRHLCHLPMLLAEVVEGCISRNSVYPCGELVLRVICLKLAEGLLEALQADVFYVFFLGDVAGNVVLHTGTVSCIQDDESCLVLFQG